MIYATDRPAFEALSLEDKLQVVADCILYWAEKKTDALAAAGKTRVESCLEAQIAYDKEKYFANVQTNVRRLAEMQMNKRIY